MTYSIIPCRLEHLRELARTMRPMDRAEIEGWGLTVRHVLHKLYRDSAFARTALVDGTVAACWGCQGSLLNGEGVPWAFTTPVIEKARLAFYRETAREIDALLATHHRLRAWVLADYTESIRFFGRMGFVFGPPEPVGTSGTLYRLMTMERETPERPPFIILGLPRSRTAWLARFLTYGDWRCHHETAIQMRSVGEAVTFLRQRNTGSAETGAAPGWKLLKHYIPDLQTVVIFRPVADVTDSMLRADLSGAATYDSAKLRRNMEHMNRSLDRIAAEPGVLAVDYADLASEATCAAIFGHCLPYRFPHEHWAALSEQNIQADAGAVLRYYFENRETIERFKALCKAEIWRLARAGEISNRIAA